MAFDREFARFLLETCRYTYSASFPDDPNEAKDCSNALEWINTNNKPTTIELLSDDREVDSTSVACVFSYPDKNIVSYMGTKTEFDNVKDATQSIFDWAENAQFVPVEFRMTQKQLGLGLSNEDVLMEGHVHLGFLNELKAIQEKVVAELMSNGGKNRDLYITGHSQGGAEAALATRAFSKGGFNVKETYTFAAPRSCNQAVVDSIPSAISIHRLEFGNDIVPHVPTTRASHELLKQAEKVLLIAEKILGVFGSYKNPIHQLDAEHDLVGVGRLCYGDNETKTLSVNITAAAEEALIKERFKKLMANPNDWAEHHHLAGTTDEIKANKGNGKGNYTALVSDFNYTELAPKI